MIDEEVGVVFPQEGLSARPAPHLAALEEERSAALQHRNTVLVHEGSGGSDRPAHPDLDAHPDLPADTRLWAALQQASGGTWAGCVYDVDRIVEVIEAGLAALSDQTGGRDAGA